MNGTSINWLAVIGAGTLLYFAGVAILLSAIVAERLWARHTRRRAQLRRNVDALLAICDAPGTVVPFKRPGRSEVIFQCVSCKTTHRTDDLTVLDTWRCTDCTPTTPALADGAQS